MWRLDQGDRPVDSGGACRVNARIRAGTHAGTCSRGAAWDRSTSPAMPSASYRPTHLPTVGRETLASSAVPPRRRPSAIHNTILARVATTADTFPELTSA